MTAESARIDDNLGDNMQVVWTVGLKNGIQLVNDPEIDLFFSQEEANAEVENRGPDYYAYIVNKDDVIVQLLLINKQLLAENAQLRAAVRG